MSPAVARLALHSVHLVLFAMLFATGLLLFVPELRAVITGGYSAHIRAIHRWGGVAFAVLPVLVIWPAGVRAVFAPPARRTVRTAWQGLHTGIAVVMGVVFTLTGVVIWGQESFPDGWVDASFLAHDWLTYAAGVLVGVHVIELGVAAVGARVAGATGS